MLTMIFLNQELVQAVTHMTLDAPVAASFGLPRTCWNRAKGSKGSALGRLETFAFVVIAMFATQSSRLGTKCVW